MTTTIPALSADQIAALQSSDLDVRNHEIAALRAVDYPAAEIAKIADIASATVYRIAKNWEPDHGYEPMDQWESVTEDDGVADMSEEFAADAEREEHAAEQAEKDAALAAAAEKNVSTVFLGTDITAYIQHLHRGDEAAQAQADALFRVQANTGEERRKAIIEASDLGVERKHIAAAAGVKSVGRIIRSAREKG
ncbi:hypothetical protein QC999_gp44 [Microbacterium phage Cressida]|uniref:Uncharacterized protein n=1 Tax=Microbacterium phage Cressida TaxID=2591216 RepID=A0A514DI54_9CAUD|nr:hypothetical protein QC999_gp44 [Microbacterium phage Cressida]QDH93306.1 hypothetical protein PBI_CRESSIDA_64 [Microbacterium phage Cressida]